MSLEIDCLLLNKITQPNLPREAFRARLHAKCNIKDVKKTVVGLNKLDIEERNYTVNLIILLTTVGSIRYQSLLVMETQKNGQKIRLFTNCIHKLHPMQLMVVNNVGYIKKFMELFFFYTYGINWTT